MHPRTQHYTTVTHAHAHVATYYTLECFVAVVMECLEAIAAGGIVIVV